MSPLKKKKKREYIELKTVLLPNRNHGSNLKARETYYPDLTCFIVLAIKNFYMPCLLLLNVRINPPLLG